MTDQTSQLLIRRTQLQSQIEEASRELEQVNKVLGFADVEFVEHVDGTNCAEWLCKKCQNVWISPNKWPCPKCYPMEPLAPASKKLRHVHVAKNERGKFEVWEEDGFGTGKHAGMATVETLEDGIATAIRRLGQPMTLKKNTASAELTYAS